MTGNDSHASQHLPAELIAELHAHDLNGDFDMGLSTRVGNDPAAKAVVDALNATVADLRSIPPIPMPDAVAARLDAALAAEVASRQLGLAPVVSIAEARKRRARRLGWGGAGLLVAAAAIAGVVLLPKQAGQGGQPLAEPSSTAQSNTSLPPLDTAVGPLAGQFVGKFDVGALDTPEKLTACLSANGIPVDPTNPKAAFLSVHQVALPSTGKPGLVFLLATGTAGKYRMLVVGQDCAAGNPAKVSDQVVGN